MLPQHLRASFTFFLFVDVLHEDTLVFKHVTLAFQVQLMVPKAELVK